MEEWPENSNHKINDRNCKHGKTKIVFVNVREKSVCWGKKASYDCDFVGLVVLKTINGDKYSIVGTQ